MHSPAEIEFLRAFEATTWPKSEWTHRAHIHMAWLYLSESPFHVALERARAGIQRYNAVHGVADAYHETVTRAFMELVQYRRLVSPRTVSFDDFAALHPDLFVRKPSILTRHYRESTILSSDARTRFVQPDLDPFPLLPNVREATPADAAAIQHIYAPYVQETAISFESEVPNVAEVSRRMAETPLAWLVAEIDEAPSLSGDRTQKRVVGYAYASTFRARPVYRWTVEVTVYASVAFHRRGVGRVLYTELFEKLTAKGYRQAIAGITLPNDASVALHEKMGFERVGLMPRIGFKLGQWHDIGFWQRPLSDLDTPPADD